MKSIYYCNFKKDSPGKKKHILNSTLTSKLGAWVQFSYIAKNQISVKYIFSPKF